jgi:fructose-1,6-bisphosphatase
MIHLKPYIKESNSSSNKIIDWQANLNNYRTTLVVIIIQQNKWSKMLKKITNRVKTNRRNSKRDLIHRYINSIVK